jgi:hypothetical protein
MKSCHHCEFRTVGCHSGCEAYAKDKQEHEAWVEQVKDAREKQRDVEGVRTMTVEKYMKRSRREWR